MAKRKGRKFRRYIRGNINEAQFLGSSLAANTGIRFVTAGTVDETTWLSSVKLTHSMNNFTVGQNIGPIAVYLAHSDYSLAEVEAFIEADSSQSWGEGDMVMKEIRSRGRRIKQVGIYSPVSGSLVTDTHVLNGGRPTRTKCGWTLTTGQGLSLIYYNTGTAACTTTSAEMQTNGHANLWPM